jgi:hypothetical protein
MSDYKVSVEVVAKHDTYGNIRPLSIKWEDGRVFEVDKIFDVRLAASLKVGGAICLSTIPSPDTL